MADTGSTRARTGKAAQVVRGSMHLAAPGRRVPVYSNVGEMMRAVIVFVAVAMGAFCGTAAAADCNIAAFGTERVRACTRGTPDCERSWVPPEVQAIQTGVYGQFVGYSVNDGTASWDALDFERRIFVKVERYAGKRLGSAPNIVSTPAEYLRETKTDKIHWIDHVRVYSVPEEEFEELACLALPLWTERENLFTLATDVSYSIVLVARGSIREHGGLGGLRGRAKEVFDALSRTR